MTLKTKVLKFNKNEITFVEYGSEWIVPAKMLGLAMEYANGGQSFSDLISNNWSKKWGPGEFHVIEGKELIALKEETSQYDVSFKQANSVLFLTIEGAVKALMRSNASMAKEFRSFFAKQGLDVLTEELQAKLLFKRPSKPQAQPQIISGPVDDLPQELRGPIALLKKMQDSSLFDNEKLSGLYLDLWNKFMAPPKNFLETMFTQVAPAKKDATQLVPVSNIQASSMTPNFETIKSFFLTGHQKHPKFPLWITAEEIGDTCGKTADQVKTFSTKYTENLGYKLPNVVLMEQVKANGGYFRGVSTMVDDCYLPCFANPILGAVAVWYLSEDGKMLWRNYWSPDAVTEIRKLMGLPPLNHQLPAPVPQALAPSPQTN